jgi:hypothetical protein
MLYVGILRRVVRWECPDISDNPGAAIFRIGRYISTKLHGVTYQNTARTFARLTSSELKGFGLKCSWKWWSYYDIICLEELRRNTNVLSQFRQFPTESPTEQLPNTSIQCCHYTTLLRSRHYWTGNLITEWGGSTVEQNIDVLVTEFSL